MKRNYSGCAICDSTWGDVWEEVEGERVFFCCRLCAQQFRALVDAVKSRTGWPAIETLEIAGDRRGRSCRATSGGETFAASFAFTSEGALLRFEPGSGQT